MALLPLRRAVASVLLTSVPKRDQPLVLDRLPGAMVLNERLSPAVADAHPETEVLSVMVHDPVDADTLARFPRLKGVVTRSTGYDHLPLDHLRARGIVVCTLGDYAVPAVAHLTLAFIIMLLRRVPEAMTVTQGRGTEPPKWDRSRLSGRSLYDVKVGVLGTGRIGGTVVRMLSALGVQVVGHDIAPDPSLEQVPGFRYVAPLSAFLAECDVLSLHVPLTPDTRKLIGPVNLSRLPRGAMLVNTARGRVVDELAVERALRSGRLAGFASDVFSGEPDPPNLARFRDLPNVVITPHLGAYDKRTIIERYDRTVRLAEAILSGDEAALVGLRVV